MNEDLNMPKFQSPDSLPYPDKQTGDGTRNTEPGQQRPESSESDVYISHSRPERVTGDRYNSSPAAVNEHAVFPDNNLYVLIAMLNPDKYPGHTRAAAMRNLSRFGEDVAADVLYMGLSDSEPRVRVATLETLVALLPFRPIPVSIIASFLHDPNALVRTSVAWYLGYFGNDTPVHLLKDVLEDERDYNVRAAALLALSKSNDPEIPELLIHQLKNRHHWQMREAAIEGLSNNEDALPFNMLRNIIFNDENELVRAAAIEVLVGRDSSLSSTIDVLQKLNQDKMVALEDEEARDFVRSTAHEAIETIIRRLLKRVQDAKLSMVQRREAILLLQTLQQLHRVPQHTQDVFVDVLEVTRSTDRKTDSIALAAAVRDRQTDSMALSLSVKPFIKLEPKDMLTRLSVLIATFFISFLRLDSNSSRYLSQRDAYQDDGFHKEYIRALLNGRTAIVPRELLYSNRMLADDFMREGENRKAFIQLLRSGAIVPYLRDALRPDQQTSLWGQPEAFAAWLRICSEVEMSCLRLNWDEKNGPENISLTSSYRPPDMLAAVQQLAHSLKSYTQSPANLLLSSVTGQPEKQPHILTELKRIVERKMKRFFNTDMAKDNLPMLYDVRLLSMLTIADVEQIRRSTAWEKYISTLEAVTKASSEYERVNLLPKLHWSYVNLMALITRHLGNRTSQNYAPTWSPVPWFEIEIGGASINIQWWQDEISCTYSGKKRPTLNDNVAPYTVTLHIGRGSIQGDVDDLSQAFVIAQGLLAETENEWKNLISVTRKHTRYESQIQPKQVAGSVLYLC